MIETAMIWEKTSRFLSLELGRRMTEERKRPLCSILVLMGLVLILGCAGGAKEAKSGEKPQSDRSQEALRAQVDERLPRLTTTGVKKRIAVMDFENKTHYGARRLGHSASEMLVTTLLNTGQFILVEREGLDKVLREQGLSMSGVINPNTAVAAGSILGLNAIVTGAVSEFGVQEGGFEVGPVVGSKSHTVRAVVDVRLIDTTTAQILMAESGESQYTSRTLKVAGAGGGTSYDETVVGKALRGAIDDLGNKIVQKLERIPWSGRIARVSGEKVYVNAGSEVGLTEGLKLTAYSMGEPIIDPSTGLTLGYDESPIGELVITQVREKYSVAIPQSGQGFREKDVVRLLGK
ncbi:MAG TPA: CsgG/HfaB family protein [Candidatus Methylomirabilis sp.]